MSEFEKNIRNTIEREGIAINGTSENKGVFTINCTVSLQKIAEVQEPGNVFSRMYNAGIKAIDLVKIDGAHLCMNITASE